MIRYESGCVDCGMPCMGRACRHYEQAQVSCDECGKDDENIYEYDGRQLCIECIEDSLTKVEA